MRANLTLTQQALILVSVPLVFEMAFVVELQSLLHQVERENARERHVRTVSVHLSELLRLIMGNSLHGLINSLARQSGYAEPVPEHESAEKSKQVAKEADLIRQLVRGYPREEVTFAQLDGQRKEILDIWSPIHAAMDKDDKVEILKLLSKVRAGEAKFLVGVDQFLAGEQAQEQSEALSQQHSRESIEKLLGLGVAFNILLAIFLAIYFNRVTAKRLQILMDNTVRLAANEPLNIPLTGNDELAHLDYTFNKMASALALAARQDRAIVDKALDVICSIDEKGALTRVSPAAQKLWGYDPVDLIGRKYLTLIAPENQAATLAAFTKIREEDFDAPVENKVVCQSGALVDMLWSASWSEEDKTLFCVAHDITERKRNETLLREAEARVRLIVESLPVGLLIIDKVGTIEFINPSSEKLCGFSRAELVGGNIAALLSQQTTSVEKKTLSWEQQTKFIYELFSETSKGSWEIQLSKRDHSKLPVEVGITKFLATGGERFLVMLVDMTERNEIERMRQEFLSMVSHDLRSPLTSVQSFLDLLGGGLCGELTEKGRRKLAAADRSISQLINMIKDLLDVERAKSGKLLIFPTEIELVKLVDQCLDTVRIQAEQTGINLQADVAELILIVDGDRLAQVIINLLTNAVKFSPAGSTVFITSRTQADWVEIRVTDRGRGIPAAHHKQIFERFQQVKASDAGYKGGTGLGLAICKAIIDQHGGTIGVDSVEGKGSSFWFRVPMRVVGNS